MPLTPAFTLSQSPIAPNLVVATDTSTGTDVAVTQRRIFFQTAYGDYLVVPGTTTDYNAWLLVNPSQSFNILTQDYAISCTVQWLDVGNTVLYTLSQVFALPQYNKQFFYYLIQQQALTPSILQDTTYFSNMANYWMNITGGIQAVEIGADISASQNCLNIATHMMNNQNLYF
jgi:hypothetical protein